MMKSNYTEHELEAYLDEELAPGEMSAIEQAMREDSELAESLRAVIARRDSGLHSVGAIWRRHRVTCPSREALGSFLLGALDAEELHYIHFHITQVGCRYCEANLDDLKQQQEEDGKDTAARRRKYLESSAGYFRDSK